MEVILKKIDAETTIPIRQKILRAGKPEKTCWFDGDMLDSTFHIGLYIENVLAGIVSVYEKKSMLFSDEIQFQIRGMAVSQDFQNRGFGYQLIVFAENELKLLNCNLIWFNARISAVGFYEKMNYIPIGTSFIIENVGEHVVMFKKI